MNYWNPKNHRFIYLHHRYGDSYPEIHFYYKVDTIEQRVWKLVPMRTKNKSKNMMKGIYEIKWSTFISGPGHYLSENSRNFIKQCETDGHKRARILYSTENQWMNAVRELLIDITKS